MRPNDDLTALLDAIDTTLAGDPVDPEHADVAELALMLRAQRSDPPPEFAARLDARVARRFVAESPPKRAQPRWLFAPALGLAVAIVVAIVVAASSGGGHHPVFANASPPKSLSQTPSAGRTQGLPLRAAAPATSSSAGQLGTALSLSPQPASRGRKVVQSSQLNLSASGDRIDDVAQEVFNVVGADHGYVNNSTVTAGGGPGAYAHFQLTVPSNALSGAMTQLSELRYARVLSRTDTSNDVTNAFNSTSSQLAQARALRTSLLKQLQNAISQSQIDALRARLADVNGTISRRAAALRSLNHQVSYSQVSLTVDSRVVPLQHKGHGFTIGRAAHDAGHVLEVAAGVALIALAVLVPVSLLAALAWWIAAALKRRRREQALDLA